MIQIAVLLCLVSVAFAHPYVSSRYYDDSSSGTPLLLETSQSYLQSEAQNEESPRTARAIEYPIQFENIPAPQVAFIELDRNFARNARSSISDQSTQSNGQYNDPSVSFGQQIPQAQDVYLIAPQNEQPSQYKSISYDASSYASKINEPVEHVPSDPAVRSGRSSNELQKRPAEDKTIVSEPPRMVGFYYMNVRKYPINIKEAFGDSDTLKTTQNFNFGKSLENLFKSQTFENEEEIMKQLKTILLQEMRSIVNHQQQEHSAYQQVTHPTDTKIVDTDSYKELDQLETQEKKILIEKLEQEKQWLINSLKDVQEYLNELKYEKYQKGNSESSQKNVANASNEFSSMKMVKNMDSKITPASNGSASSSIESSPVSSMESLPSAFSNEPKETA